MVVNKQTEFVVLTALVVLTRICDWITTYMVTPDLSREMNPLAGGGWLTLIFSAAVILALSVWLNYQNLFRPIDNFNEYANNGLAPELAPTRCRWGPYVAALAGCTLLGPGWYWVCAYVALCSFCTGGAVSTICFE